MTAITVPGLIVPLIEQMLGGMARSLSKGLAFATARKFDFPVLLQSRLAPDQLPLFGQVQLATDFARRGVARLTGGEVESWPDSDATFDGLQARIARTLEVARSIPVAAYDGCEDRTIEIKAGDRTMSFSGLGYLTHFLIPNLTFHTSAAYLILRHNGVELGKMDFVNAPPRP